MITSPIRSRLLTFLWYAKQYSFVNIVTFIEMGKTVFLNVEKESLRGFK